MAFLSGYQYESVVLNGQINYSKEQLLLGGLMGQAPRIVAIDANAAAPAAGANPLWEVGYEGSNAATATFGERGLTVTANGTGANDNAVLTPLVSTAALPTAFTNGVGSGSTARTDGTSVGSSIFKTGAAADTDSGRGIGLWTVIELPSIASIEVAVGFFGATFAKMPGLTDASLGAYTYGDDGFGLVFNSSDSTVFRRWANYGAGPTDEIVATGVTVQADRRYLLEMWLDESRQPQFKINGLYVGTLSAIDAETIITPFVLVRAITTAAKVVYLKDLVCHVGWIDG